MIYLLLLAVAWLSATWLIIQADRHDEKTHKAWETRYDEWLAGGMKGPMPR